MSDDPEQVQEQQTGNEPADERREPTTAEKSAADLEPDGARLRKIVARSDDLGTALAMREWDEAWSQSRHLENMRGQYLGFFFAALLGVTAIAADGIADESFATPGSILTVAALALGFHTLAAFVYLAVVRINVVLDYYLAIIWAIRDQVHAQADALVDLRPYARPPSPPRAGRAARTTLWHGTELILLLASVGFPLLLASCVVRATMLERNSTTTVALCSLAFAASLVTGFYCRWILHPRGSAKSNSRSDSPADRPDAP